MVEGKVSSKYQLTLPAEVRKALGIKPGDTVRYEVVEGKLRVSVVRPNISRVLEELWAEHDTTPLHEELGGDAVAHMRKQRGWDDLNDER
jgi:antitoxin PrlF